MRSLTVNKGNRAQCSAIFIQLRITMSTNIRAKVAYGLSQPNFPVPLQPIISGRDPRVTDYAEVGTEWINRVTNQVWVLTSVVLNQAIWTRVDNTNVNLGLTWSIQAGVGPIALNSNYGYYLTNAGAVTLALPAAAVLGAQIFITTADASAGGAGITITQGAGQYILYGGNASTIGVGGSLDGLNFGNRSLCLQLICTVANTEFTVFNSNFVPNLV